MGKLLLRLVSKASFKHTCAYLTWDTYCIFLLRKEVRVGHLIIFFRVMYALIQGRMELNQGEA